jgi:hypothetical protein
MTETLEAPTVTESTPVSAEPATAPASAPAPPSTTAIAIARCLEAYRCGYNSAAAKGQSHYFANQAGALAYRHVVPSTETFDDIQALIACVAKGVNLHIYEGRESTQLLYAAQVALASRKSPKPEKAKSQKSTPEK